MSYLAAMLDTVGVQVNVGSLLAPYLIQEIVQADRLHLLMSSSRNRCIFIALKLLFPDAALLLFNGAFQLHFIALKLLFPGVGLLLFIATLSRMPRKRDSTESPNAF